MTLDFRARLAAAAACVALLGACSADQVAPSGPVSRASLEVVSPAVPAVPLMRKLALKGNVTVSATIDPNRGGILAIPPLGLVVWFPPGAVSQPTVVSATAIAGRMVMYEFGPHGTQFGAPVTISQDLTPTSWFKNLNPASFEGGYFKDRSQVDAGTGTVLVDEFFPVRLSAVGNRVEFQVRHFSGYLLSTGRKEL